MGRQANIAAHRTATVTERHSSASRLTDGLRTRLWGERFKRRAKDGTVEWRITEIGKSKRTGREEGNGEKETGGEEGIGREDRGSRGDACGGGSRGSCSPFGCSSETEGREEGEVASEEQGSVAEEAEEGAEKGGG